MAFVLYLGRHSLILRGEPPCDTFVRWKPLHDQPMGWEPDLNDGGRIKIRPFMTAGVLRHSKPSKLNIKWTRAQGKHSEAIGSTTIT